MKSACRYRALIFLFWLLVGAAEVKVADGAWLAKVPERDRQKTNPFHSQQEAASAGKLLFSDHCASCHGKEAVGNNKHPSLHTERIQTATEGELIGC